MPKLCAARGLTPEEGRSLDRLAASRAAAVRLAERARAIRLSTHGRRVPAIARAVGRSEQTVRRWIERFNAGGLDGLADAPRSGRPPAYTREEVGVVVAAALTAPDVLGLPFGSWTLDRLEAYLNEERGIGIKRSRIDELLVAEGLRWRRQESWFGERVDPEFAAKRGRSRPSTPRRPPTAS